MIGASAINAYVEESMWRRELIFAFEGTSRGSTPAIVGSSISFGLAHLWALPGGWSGMTLTLLFSVETAAVNQWTRSMVPSLVGHFAADVALLSSVLGLWTFGTVT